ncbi:hypothetical protein B0T24DRAFT_615939 [Lasiosphaeria ovina]|uniref:F-box domain-containing protein n=1 Tax=Lasiosphaeria ovina TaxID=92902 RepID=A0AAE0TV27_9PEZI|nr:hypothetical protein B0T24DRAFT_615939 [Lasiosphaeria ovina]
MGISKLPTEMILAIMKYLPEESVVIFSLTCRNFYWRFFSSSPRLSRLGRDKLLRRLEIDWRQYVYCDVREKLIRWDWASGNGDSARCCNYHVRPRLFGTNLVTVRLVMNRYFHGGENGLPLSVLDRDSVDKDADTGVQVRSSWRARIIDHDLFVHGTFTIKHPAGDHTALRRYMKRFKRDLLVRPHISPKSPPLACSDDLSHAIPDCPDHSMPTSTIEDADLRCPYCDTDYRIDSVMPKAKTRAATKKQRRRCPTIVVKKWHNLGICRISRGDQGAALENFCSPVTRSRAKMEKYCHQWHDCSDWPIQWGWEHQQRK